MIELDGAQLTGGGQIIRTALALSAHTNKPFHIINIRKGRPKPGLMAQHLEAVRMMRTLCNAEVRGMQLRSAEITFIPKGFTPRPLDIHIGTAGSITLLSQALMLPAMHHKKTTYTIHGGTDVRWSPPIDYARYVIAPMLSHFGVFEIDLQRRGYYPSGQGKASFTFGMHREVQPLTLIERGLLERIHVVSNASQKLLDKQILEDVERGLRVHLQGLGPLHIRNEYANTIDPGWGITAYTRYNLGEPRMLMGADVLGETTDGPQDAAARLARQLKERLDSPGCIDEHLADHLIPFLALHGGEFTTTTITNHIRANIAVAEAFTSARFTIEENRVRVSISSD